MAMGVGGGWGRCDRKDGAPVAGSSTGVAVILVFADAVVVIVVVTVVVVAADYV